MQGGHKSNASAEAGDKINVNPVSWGGPVVMGNINTGSKTQAPKNEIGGSQGSAGFSADLSGLKDLIGQSAGMPAMPPVMVLNLQQQPQQMP